jgi:hypothetical protein
MTPADVPWIRDLFERRLNFPGFDADTAQAWFVNCVLTNPVNFYAVRTADAFLIAFLRPTPWLPAALDCRVVTVCTDVGKVWQALPLLKASVAWARHRGEIGWQYESDTMHDIGPLVRRLGAAEITPRYRIEL